MLKWNWSEGKMDLKRESSEQKRILDRKALIGRRHDRLCHCSTCKHIPGQLAVHHAYVSIVASVVLFLNCLTFWLVLTEALTLFGYVGTVWTHAFRSSFRCPDDKPQQALLLNMTPTGKKKLGWLQLQTRGRLTSRQNNTSQTRRRENLAIEVGSDSKPIITSPSPIAFIFTTTQSP